MALLELRKVSRSFASGEGQVFALRNVDLSIEAGEMVAITGASGSGKSTLMYLLGCLDRPSAGCYLIDGEDAAQMDSDELARLRRERFGFIFQRYHLIAHLDALANVEMPAIYAGLDGETRMARAAELLKRMGLAERAGHRPGQLSGGQQQRVSIARALMNGGEIILADEPTGALDSESGQEMMNILHDLHRSGHTIIIVTHDPNVAKHAQRVIELRDGSIIGDTNMSAAPRNPFTKISGGVDAAGISLNAPFLLEAFRMAWVAMRGKKLRSFLTMLGIVIGIASVVSIMALGEGAKKSVINSVKELASNNVTIWRGRGWADDQAEGIQSLTPGDMSALLALPGVKGVSPQINGYFRLRYRELDADGGVFGASVDSVQMFGLTLASGRSITESDIRDQRQVVIIDDNARRRLFPSGENPIGKYLLVGNLPCEIIGIADRRPSIMGVLFGEAGNLMVWMPYTTAGIRLFGRSYFDAMIVHLDDGFAPSVAERTISRLLELRHGRKDFFVNRVGDQFDKVEKISLVLTAVLSLIAAISLLVGGVGVMNIMLVSVTERIQEIGVRMAVGARERDIQMQFLTESVLLCLLGGLIGVALVYLIAFLIPLFTDIFEMEVSPVAVLGAVFVSSLTGIIFGYLPSTKAARLNPAQALVWE